MASFLSFSLAHVVPDLEKATALQEDLICELPAAPKLARHQRCRQAVRGCDTCKPTLRCSLFKHCLLRLHKTVLLKLRAHPDAASSARDTEFFRAELEKAGVPRHRITAILKRYPTYTSVSCARMASRGGPRGLGQNDYSQSQTSCVLLQATRRFTSLVCKARCYC